MSAGFVTCVAAGVADEGNDESWLADAVVAAVVTSAGLSAAGDGGALAEPAARTPS